MIAATEPAEDRAKGASGCPDRAVELPFAAAPGLLSRGSVPAGPLLGRVAQGRQRRSVRGTVWRTRQAADAGLVGSCGDRSANAMAELQPFSRSVQ